MRELQLVLSDDLTFTQAGERVPADETVVISLDGKTRELDLTATHAKELRELLAPWLNAGHTPGGQPAAPPPGQGPQPSALVASRARQKLIRDFADARGLRSPDGTRPVYRTGSGGYYYPDTLMKMYEKHLHEEDTR